MHASRKETCEIERDWRKRWRLHILSKVIDNVIDRAEKCEMIPDKLEVKLWRKMSPYGLYLSPPPPFFSAHSVLHKERSSYQCKSCEWIYIKRKYQNKDSLYHCVIPLLQSWNNFWASVDIAVFSEVTESLKSHWNKFVVGTSYLSGYFLHSKYIFIESKLHVDEDIIKSVYLLYVCIEKRQVIVSCMFQVAISLLWKVQSLPLYCFLSLWCLLFWHKYLCGHTGEPHLTAEKLKLI